MTQWITVVSPCDNGKWRARLETHEGKTLKVGEPQDSILSARGSLMTLYPEYFCILENMVVGPDPDQREKVGY